MEKLNDWIQRLAHNYFLIVVGALIFFAVKAVIGYMTYKHYNRELADIKQQLRNVKSKNKP